MFHSLFVCTPNHTHTRTYRAHTCFHAFSLPPVVEDVMLNVACCCFAYSCFAFCSLWAVTICSASEERGLFFSKEPQRDCISNLREAIKENTACVCKKNKQTRSNTRAYAFLFTLISNNRMQTHSFHRRVWPWCYQAVPWEQDRKLEITLISQPWCGWEWGPKPVLHLWAFSPSLLLSQGWLASIQPPIYD